MNNKIRLNIISGLFLMLLVPCGKIAAEGTKELSPAASDVAMLHTNAAGFGDFASYTSFGATSALKIRITDATNDSIYIGLSAEADDFGLLNSSYQFRILNPAGVVVFGPFTIGTANDNAETWALAANGPDVNGMGGYSTNTGSFPYSRFKPTMTGDYTIQFDDGSPFNIVNVKFFDFTVRNGGVVQNGRLWSRNWAIRTPPINPNTPPECQFDRPFNGQFYSYTMDGFVSRLDFNGSGFQGLSFTVSFGDRGPGTTGDVIIDRRSVKGMNATATNAEHMVFINDPDNVAFPSSPSQCGTVSLISVGCTGPNDYCINVGVTQSGQVEVILDFNNNGMYDVNTTDVILAMFFTVADTACIPWNGLKGDGSPIVFGEQVPSIIRYSQGVQHYAGFDVEFLKNGFCVQAIRPVCPGVATDLLYWDDSQITDDVVTVTIDEGDPGTGQPKIQFNGCTCGVAGCRSWDNFQIGDPPTGTCIGTPFGYGDNSTLNTWWFASTVMLSAINLPFAQVSISGDSAICNGDSTIFTANVFPDTTDFLYAWTGPGGFMANTPTTGFVSQAGTYYVTISDTITNCTASDSVVLIVFNNPTTTVAFVCLGPNQQNANVNLTVSGGQMPYSFLWSNGAMTEDLTNVPPGQYSVIVTDNNGCMAFDTVVVEGCCDLVVVCPPVDGGQFSCLDEVPVMNMDVVTVSQFCDDVTISAQESDNGGAGCPTDTLFITRIFTVEDAAGNIQTCTQIYTVVDNVAPTLQNSVPDTSIICGDPISAALLGIPVYLDNCSNVTLTYSDDSTGFNGMCNNSFIGFVSRTFYAEDDCGNIDSSLVQTISIIDTIPPTFTTPTDVTIDCSADISPVNTGEILDSLDNCSGVMSVSFSDQVIPGMCPVTDIVLRTWVVTDICGNSAQGVQQLTLIDTIPPTFTVPANIQLDCGADLDPQFTGDVTDASDLCSGATVSYTDLIVPDGCPVNDTVFRTWVVVDGCNNSSSGVQTILRLDTDPPTFTTPADTILDCGMSTDTAFTGSITDAMDNCSDITISYSDMVVSGVCPGIDTTFRTWVASDNCSNSSTGVQTIIRIDTLSPVITFCPPDVTISCTDVTDPQVLGFASASDNCDPTVDISFSDIPPPAGCSNGNPIQRTWTATDDCGNTATCVQSIQVQDNEPPTFTLPDDITLSCDEDNSPAVAGEPSNVGDNCGIPVVTFSDVIVAGNCSPFADTVLRTWVVTDLCGNSTSGVQNIYRVDIEPPTFTVPPQTTIACDQDSFPSTTGMVTDTLDNCSFMVVDFTDLVLPNGCPTQDTIERTWIVTDLCGNSTTAIQYILRLDQVAPTFTVPADTIIDCGVSTLPGTTGDVTDAADNCSMISISFTDVTIEGVCPELLIINRTWVVMDDCNNASSGIQVITVQDTTSPVFMVPADITIDCELDINDLNLTGNVTGVSDCNGVQDTTYVDAIGIPGCDGTAVIFRTWTITDFCNNTSSAVQFITIQDTLPPNIVIPADITIECDQNPLDTTITGGMIVFMDNCSMMFGAMFSDDNSGLTGCNGTGTILRTWLVDDECDNASSMTQVITIVDQTPPTALCQNLTIDFSNSNTIIITPEQIDNGSADNCGAVTLSLSQTEFTCDQFVQTNSIPVVLTVTDLCGNTSTCEAQVMGVGGVLEINCPSDINIYLTGGQCTAFVNYNVTANAICGGIPILTQTDNTGLTSGDAFPIGTTIQTWTASNNTSSVSCSFNINVFEYTGPVVLVCNDTVNVSVDNNCEGHIFSDMILEGNQYTCYDNFIISIQTIGTDTGWIVFDAMDFIGGYYNVTITDPASGNSCWGVVHIEDKIAPQIICACPPGSTAGDTCEISCLEVDLLVAGNIPAHLYPQIIDNCGYTLEISHIEVDDQGCGQGTVIVSWLVTDFSGHSASCDQLFNITPLSPEDLVFPPNYVGNCGTSSHPNVTGWPTINGYQLTDQAGLCNLFMGYWDKALEDCGGGQKILRTWTVLDWCTLQLTESKQVIKLSDTEGPVLVCPSNLTVGTDFWFCHANVSVPKPTAYDVCSDITSYSLISSAGTIVQFGNNYVLNGIPLGTHFVTWTVTDRCGNSSTCSFSITVKDNVVPVGNCDAHTVVGLTTDGPMGITLVPASVFDDGSYDNCGPVTFRARRMQSCLEFDWTTNGACIDDIPDGFINANDAGTTFKPCVPFSCCDVKVGSRAAPIMVELEITDLAGNKNYCMIEVEVQDKIPAFIACPPDIFVSCDFWFPAVEGTYRDALGNRNGNLDEDPLSAYFGNMFDGLFYNNDQSVRKPIIINDPANNQYAQPHNWGLDGWAKDNCLADLEVRVTVYSDCSGSNLPGNPPPGAVKLIERRFVVRDNQQGFSPSVCVQRIWVVDFKPFYISDKDCNNTDTQDGVRWPCDILITNCPDDIGFTGEPLIFADACNLIGVTYVDTRFEFSEGACFKILREWKVIDWCQYNSVTGYGLWSYTQVIKVNDKTPPTFLSCPQSPVVLCVEDPGVRLPATNQVFLGENDPNASSCSVHVTLVQKIRESCNGTVAYDVKYYPFNGTEFILVKPRTIAQLDANHEADLIFNSEESTIQSIRRNGLPYNSPWCNSYHKILWSVEDGCGNWSHCEYLFRLEDCKQPSPVCIQGLSTVVMPVGCEVTLWAKDFNASSSDDCTPASNLLYSFSGTAYEPSKTFNSTNIPAFGVELSIEIWAADGGNDDNCNGSISWDERNKDFCTTTIVFNDNTGDCDHSGSIVYQGTLLTEHNAPIETAKVTLINNTQAIYAMNTSDNGKYVLVVPEIDGQRYNIQPKRLDQPRNGVSTLDLVRIQKHLLGKEYFDSPYQYIAADANNNQQVSAIDLVEIRKLILGIYSAFPNNDSWRFVDKKFVMPNPQHPWPFEEEINIQYDGSSLTGLDFIGVKIGDVNNTVKANAFQILPRNDRRKMIIEVNSPETVNVGETVDVQLTFPEHVSGFQWTLETSGLEYTRIYSDDIAIGPQHVAVLHDGVITMSWNEEDWNQSLNQGKMSFHIQFVATHSGRIADLIRLSDQIADAEAYTFDDEILDLSLRSRSVETEVDFALYQNEPNPWSGVTTISFELPESGWVQLTLFDVTGKAVRMIEGEYQSGHQTIQLHKKDLPVQGIFYYRLDCGNYSATKKMIRLE